MLPSDTQLDEIYVVNLLSHKKVAYDKFGLEHGGQEYWAARAELGDRDPINYLCLDLLQPIFDPHSSVSTPPFADLREYLDRRFAALSESLAPELNLTRKQVEQQFWTEQMLKRMALLCGIQDSHELINWNNITRLAHRFDINTQDYNQDAGLLKAVVRAFHPTRIEDPFEYSINLFLNPEPRNRLEEAKFFAREQRRLIGADDGEEQRADELAVSFGFGHLDTQQEDKLLTYAALERRLDKVQQHFTDIADDLLIKCQRLRPQARELAELRFASALELEGCTRTAVDALIVTLSADERDEGETLAAWSDSLGIEFRWGPAAEIVGPVGTLEVVLEQPRAGFAGRLTRMIKSDRTQPCVTVCTADQGEVVCIYGLGDARTSTLMEYLPGELGDLAGLSLKERVLHCPLPHAEARLPSSRDSILSDEHVTRLLASVLDFLRPKPLSVCLEDAERVVDVSLAIDNATTTLVFEEGDSVFEWPALDALVRELETDEHR